MDIAAVLRELEALGDPSSAAGMARFGITPAHTFGVRLPALRALARRLGRDHELALALWEQDNREARILASMVAVPDRVTEAQMEAWAAAFDYWEICDQVVMNLFRRTRFAVTKAHAWSERDETFVKRAGFVLMAQLAAGRGRADEATLRAFLPVIAREACDDREMVKKAVNWALRQIGKRTLALHRAAIATAEAILAEGTAAGRWIARDALRELRSEAVRARLNERAGS